MSAHERRGRSVVWMTATTLALLFAAGADDDRVAALAQPPSSAVQHSRDLALPGAEPVPLELATRLWGAYDARGPGYEPRTEHLRPDGTPAYVNRLILEDSPYLIQHAHNPVNWFAWGPEAFDKARREGKIVFLSIGYSTCHWCHVMERESFDNVEVARLLNDQFVAIKVDRERRPDVDEVYMTAVRLLTGSGGWPMSTFLTPDGKPFFGGTYFPRATFLTLLGRGAHAWQQQRPEILAQADQVAAAVREVTTAAGEAVDVGDDLVAAAVRESLSRHDSTHGGFSDAPKFPHEPELLLLLDRVLRIHDPQALLAVQTSLDHMARGGIYDQVGGGFHRYSTDAHWLVPHFEKMLYNQAHLSRVYLEAFHITGNVLYRRVARQTLDYVLHDMTSPAGAFYSATDADSEGTEGAFFLWTAEKLRRVLPAEDAALAIEVYGVTAGGNFEGKNILHLPKPLPEVAADQGMRPEELFGRVDRIRQRLYEQRETRIHPLRDEKIVTAWNGMMITALARAADILGDRRYLEAATRAATFIWEHNHQSTGGLWRIHLDGSSSVTAILNDHAYLSEAFVTLYDASGERRWLDRARLVADTMIDRFWDTGGLGFFMSEDDHGGWLMARPKSPSDGAIPSGNSVAVRALTLLAARTGAVNYRHTAEEALTAFSSRAEQRPTGFAYMLLGAAELLHGGAGPLAYGSRGVVRAKAELGSGPGARPLAVHLDLADGWHVNANQPLQDAFIPTALSLEDRVDGIEISTVAYPDADIVTLGFQDEPLAVYQGRVSITGTLLTSGRTPPPLIIPLRLTIQACDDRQCLVPEDLMLEVPVRATGGTAAGGD